MLRLVEALNFRSLRFVRQEMTGQFHVLVGPNASGKSTFLGVVRFLGDLLADGLEATTERLTQNAYDLFWMKATRSFEVAVEIEIPKERRHRGDGGGWDRARYEVGIGFTDEGELAITSESLWLKPSDRPAAPVQRSSFPDPATPPDSLFLQERRHAPKGWKRVVLKAASGTDYFAAERTDWKIPFRLGPRRLALANLPEDEDRFPIATWVKRFLVDGIQYLALNGETMRRPSPPGRSGGFRGDGSNLPWAIEQLRQANGERFARWCDHIRTALPDVDDIETVEREEDKHRYLRIRYASGLTAPSWAVSDGTLRLLALTLLAYLPGADRIYLVEEPENGIHPQAVETVFQSLAGMQGSQVLCATHSPVVLSLAEPSQLLCFAKSADGATDIVRGDEHPRLLEWRRDSDLGVIFATGILGG